MLNEIIKILTDLEKDFTVPRNVRRAAEEAKTALLDKSTSMDVRRASATSILDEITKDTNLPIHARTILWDVMSKLESAK